MIKHYPGTFFDNEFLCGSTLKSYFLKNYNKHISTVKLFGIHILYDIKINYQISKVIQTPLKTFL